MSRKLGWFKEKSRNRFVVLCNDNLETGVEYPLDKVEEWSEMHDVSLNRIAEMLWLEGTGEEVTCEA